MATSPNLLYVEDDLQSREVMQLLVQEMMGIPSLVIFEDSTDFLARVERLPAPPDVVLLDIHVTPHNGFAMLKMLRDHPTYTRLPIIALTASVMNEEVRQLQEAGFNGVIPKPVDIDRFPDMLTLILNHHPLWNTIL